MSRPADENATRAPAPRSYRELCGVAKALDVLGERWTLLIVRNLLVGGQRYSDLLDTLPGITTNLLAERLAQLTAAGIVTSRTLPPPVNRSVYELTSVGRELEPVVLALGRFGARYLATPSEGDRTHVRWAMVSLMRRYRGVKQPASLGLHVDGEHHYVLRMDRERLDVSEGESDALDAQLHCTAEGFRALVFGGVPLRQLLARGAVELRGSRRVATAWARAIGASV